MNKKGENWQQGSAREKKILVLRVNELDITSSYLLEVRNIRFILVCEIFLSRSVQMSIYSLMVEPVDPLGLIPMG